MSDTPAPPEPPVPALIRCQVTFTDWTQLPKNQYVNTWHFRHPNVAGPDYGDAVTALAPIVGAFYETAAAPSVTAVGAFLANYLSRSYTLKFYNMGSIQNPRPPTLFTRTLPASVVATDLPAEVALCTSFRTNIANDAARGRGRVYIGPLNTQAANTGAAGTSYPQPTSLFVGAVVNATKRLVVDANAHVDVEHLVVYSRVDDDIYPVHNGWVDNAWDTQRRRGQLATTRTAWTTAS